MHVPGNLVPRSGRPPFAAAVVAMFASVAGIANAVEFDDKVNVPQSKDAVELRSRAEVYSIRDAQARLAGLDAVVRNRQLARERFDASWDLQRAIDDRQSIGDLSALGIVDRGDGTFSVDLNAYPQWSDPAYDLAGILPSLNPTLLGAELARRGMQQGEVATLREYLATHDVNATTAAAALPIAVSFSRLVKKLDKLKRPVPDALVRSYIYQRDRATAEARRAWAESLLDAIGPSAARVVESYLGEMRSSGVWSPADTRYGIDGLLTNLRLPDFEQKAAAEAKGGTP
jgi:hypothetical protein